MMQPDMARAPTYHPPLWPVASGGAPVQASPLLYTVVWQGDEALGTGLADFAAWMLQSDYWTQSLAEYGVGAGTGKGLIVLPTPPPATMTDDDLRMLAQSLITSGQVQAGESTQIAFAPSPATTLTSSAGTGCVDIAGYHERMVASVGTVTYDVIMRCQGQAGDPLDQATYVLSHEAAESATDPNPDSGKGWIAVPPSPRPYEVADLCNFNSSISIDVPADATHPARRYWVQRLYSAKRAADGTIDPCVPLIDGRPYWNVALDPAVSTLTLAQSPTLAARLDVFSYGGDPGLIKYFIVSPDGNIDVEPASGSAHAGDTIPVTITVSHGGGLRELDILSESESAGAAMWISYVEVK